MKKLGILLVAVLSISVLSFFVVSPVFASELYRGGPGNGGIQEDPDAVGQRGSFGTGTGIPLDQSINLDGILEDLLHASLAEALSMDIADLTARMDAGETFSAIALSEGFDSTAIIEMIVEARADAVAQAVVEGLITQEQADWMSSRGNRMPAANFGDEGICDLSGECLKDGVQQSTMMEYGYRKGYMGNK
ncbi:MAG: hypothetical protein HQ574_02365 [Chloroflexi bacterium]|nr:hypothetical protein [Chloroflexota bacterium]